jgi:AcrR family transcriptional regulator
MHGVGSATRIYSGLTAEQRSTARRRALIEAAMDLFAEAGARAVTKRAVCARARLNDRYFYQHFSDSDALLEAVAHDVTTRGIEAVVTTTLTAPPDVAAQVHAAADAALNFITADPRRSRLLLGSHTTEVLQRARLASTHQIADVMSAMTRELLGDDAAAPMDTELAAFTLVSGTLELVAAWFRGEFPTSRAHLADLVAALLLASTDIATALQRKWP